MDYLNVVGAAIEDKYISAGIVDFKERKVIPNTLRRRRVDPKGPAEEIINKWAECLAEVLELNKGTDVKLGMGIPNQLDYDSGVYLDNDPLRYGSLYKKNIKALLAEKLNLETDAIQIRNVDANFFQGEVFAGAVRGYSRSFGITLGLGLGTARYADGVVEDANLWKTPFKDSIAEDYLSERFLLKRFFELTGIEVADIPEMKSFRPNPNVEKAFAELGTNLAEFIIEVIKKERPEVILIGGQMESSYKFYFDLAVGHVRAAGYHTPIIKAILGERAYVIGAAAIWSDLLLHQ